MLTCETAAIFGVGHKIWWTTTPAALSAFDVRSGAVEGRPRACVKNPHAKVEVANDHFTPADFNLTAKYSEASARPKEPVGDTSMPSILYHKSHIEPYLAGSESGGFEIHHFTDK
jgi:hypothetical protein